MLAAEEYDRRARALRRPPLESADGTLDLRECVRLGVLAASSHNTQPWRFAIEERRLRIFPDPARRCPVVDPDDAHLYESLGCAAENVCHAAAAQGFGTQVEYDRAADCIVIELDREAQRGSIELARAIPHRQCTKLPYDGSPLGTGELEALERSGEGAGVRTVLITDRERIEQVVEFVSSGNRTQLSDAEFRAELLAWIRFNPGAALATGDGLSGRVSRQPALPTWLGRRLAGFVLSGERQAALDAQCIRSSAAIAVTLAREDAAGAWIEAGRVWQRLALRATALGIRSAFINQPIEVRALRPQLAS